MKKLNAACVRVNSLKPAEIDEMFRLFCDYYANVSYEQFKTDLLKKEHVFVMRDPRLPDIKGFSTIVAVEATTVGKDAGRTARGFFSGDTVIHQDYWGQGALGIAFLKFLFLQKLRRPFSPLYWFLISKGYKTYLMMANNFACYYPRYDQPTPPDIQVLLDSFATQLYPESYQPATGLIVHPEDQAKDRLKTQVAPICEKLLLENPRIAFFAERNPGWKQGDELACLGEMTFMMPFEYQFKLLRKQTLRIFGRLLPGFKPSPLPPTEESATT
ncbi:MAG: hypothetical protein ACAI44_24145 [Candidatus Sericytochromatia bacterium]